MSGFKTFETGKGSLGYLTIFHEIDTAHPVPLEILKMNDEQRMGADKSFISQITGLSFERIEQLEKEMRS
ncbi:MAG: hypothetical protein I8H75_00390 [Myxococcaceae bacterium]|nr:hypothetical protein [Myxococcaceae bacterium]MBH2005803.1 hypothetical protein [Myxococcaceae bacterium]